MMTMTAGDVVAVLDRLDAAGIAVSVAGGWGVDALLGRETRTHGDLDLAIDADLVDDAVGALAGLGLAIVADERPARLAVGDAARQVDLHPVAPRPHGTGRQTGLRGEVYVYPPGSTDASGTIGGRRVRCLTPELLLRFHLGYDPRPIDRADMAALAEQFGLELPSPY